MAAALRATWVLLFWPTWPAAVDRALLLDERSLSQIEAKWPKKAISQEILKTNFGVNNRPIFAPEVSKEA